MICQCWHKFQLDHDFNAPVYFYYGLSNFYQNHRRYDRSRDYRQLEGKVKHKLSKDCKPFDKIGDRQIAPCGAIANSLFNDTFKLFMRTDNSMERIDLVERQITWYTDREEKYENPPKRVHHKYVKPPYWQKSVFDLDPNQSENNGYKNEHLIVWMQTSFLPQFRKLWARIDHDQNILWRTKLPRGNYTLLINYSESIY